MRLDELLNNRDETGNFKWDFSDLSKDELKLWIHARMYGEESLSDLEMKQLEEATAKIKKIPGKSRECKPLKAQWDGRSETAEEFMNKAMQEFLQNR